LKKTHHTKFNEPSSWRSIWALTKAFHQSSADGGCPNGLGKTVRVLVIAGGEKFAKRSKPGGFRRRRRIVQKIMEGWTDLRRRDRHAGHECRSAEKLGKVLARAA